MNKYILYSITFSFTVQFVQWQSVSKNYLTDDTTFVKYLAYQNKTIYDSVTNVYKCELNNNKKL